MKLTANSLHPGAIATNLFRYNGFFNGKNLDFMVLLWNQILHKDPVENVLDSIIQQYMYVRAFQGLLLVLFVALFVTNCYFPLEEMQKKKIWASAW